MDMHEWTIEIARALGAKDVRALEEAFRALVGYPNEDEIEGASADSLMAALENVSTALQHDTSVMPSDTCTEMDLPAGATYADGAADVAARRDQWAGYFTAKVPAA